MAAPTPVAVAEILATTVTPTTPTSVSWQTGDVVVVMAGTEGNGAESWTAPTNTGSGLSFTQQQLHSSASNCGGGIWTAVASANSSGTFAIHNPGTSENVVLIVYIDRASAGVGNSNMGASSARTLSLTPTGPDGKIIWGVFDWAAAAVQAETPTATVHSTSSPGPQASPLSAVVGTAFTYYVQDLDQQVSAGSVSYGIGGSGAGPFTILAIEVKASAGGAAAGDAPYQLLTPGFWAAQGAPSFVQGTPWGQYQSYDAGVSGALFAQALDGAVTPLAASSRTVSKPLTAVAAPAGVLGKQTGKPLAGAITPAGAPGKQANKPLAGAVSPAGVLTTLKLVARAFAGSITPAGVVAKLAGKPLSGLITPIGSPAKQANKPLTASISLAGALSSIRLVLRVFAGAVTPAGALVKQANKQLPGAVSPAGAVSKQASKSLLASVTPAGALSLFRAVLRVFAGAVTPVGAVSKQTQTKPAGLTAPGGAVSKQTGKSLLAAIGPAGALSSVRVVLRTFTGAANVSGALGKKILKPLSGAIGPAGALVKSITKPLLAGAVSPAGTLSRARTIARILIGQSSPAGSISKLAGKTAVGSTSIAGTVAKAGRLALSGAAAVSGVAALLLNPAQAATALRIRLHGREPTGLLARVRGGLLHGRRGGIVTGEEEGTP